MVATWGAEGRLALVRNVVAALGISVAIFLLSYANGGFATTTRAYAAIAAWWLIGAGAALTLWTARAQISRLAIAAPALLALYALWTLLSMSWAPDGERAFAQFNQVSLYVAVLILAIVAGRLIPASWIVGGIALALSAIAIVAFVSRVFPSTFSGSTSQAQFLNTLYVRLSFPLGYWNGLGIEAALAFPLLLSLMVSRRSRVASALAALPLPVIAADMYLTSSRGAFAAAAVAIVVFLLLTANRWTALAATVATGISFALAVDFVHSRRELVNGQTASGIGNHEAHVAALAVLLIAVGTALVWLGVAEVARRWSPPLPPVVGWATSAVLAIVVLAGIVLSHPIRRFEEFKAQAHYSGSSNFITTHLLSSSGSGRWQLWSDAASQFRAHPLNGGGAGSYLYWWLEHRPLGLYSQYAHSLYLETLGELGIIGLLLLAAAVLVSVAGGIRASLTLRSPAIAGLAACGIAFFAAAAYDWVWQLSGIAMAGVGALGVTLGTLPSSRALQWGRIGLGRPLLALVAVAAIVPQVVILASGLHLANSQTADLNGNLGRAKSQALAQKAVEPWASSAYLQLALIDEQMGLKNEARTYLGEAIRRSPNDWHLWADAASLDVRRGQILQAKHELDHARALDPLEPALQGG